MQIIGGPPPLIEDPTPGFGEVIGKLNELLELQFDQTSNFNNSIHRKIDEANDLLQKYADGIIVDIDNHLALKGPVHGETKDTIGLGKKDNFSVATQAEHNNFSPVDAFVTPLRAKTAVLNTLRNFSPANYQTNGVFRMASYFNQDEYPVSTPPSIQPTRYHQPKGWTPILMNADRLIFLPKSDVGRYVRQNLYIGMQTKSPNRTQADEIINVDGQYLGSGWNQTGCDSSNGRVNFFKALADKKIYQFRNELSLPRGVRNYLLYRGYSGQIYRGVGVSCSFDNGILSLGHEFFHADLYATDPVLRPAVANNYPASFSQIGVPTTYGFANGSHDYKLENFVNAPGGTRYELVDNGVGIVITLFWDRQDIELCANITVPIRAILPNGFSRILTLSFTEAIVPGTMKVGGNAGFSLMGDRVRDTLDATLTPNKDSRWFKVTDITDLNDMSQFPGVLLDSGVMVKAMSGKYGVRVKSAKTEWKGLKEWVLGVKSEKLDVAKAVTTMLVPSRHNAFGSIPERVIPISQGTEACRYLVYHLDSSTGRFGWSDLEWDYTNPVSVQNGNKFGVRPPQRSSINKTLANFPSGVVSMVDKGSSSVQLNAWVFTTLNNFEGRNGFGYSNKTLSPGNSLKLDPLTKMNLNAVSYLVLERAKAAHPEVNDALRERQVQVYGLPNGKVICLVTDGVNYGEVAIANGSSNGSIFTVAASGSLTFTRVTQSTIPVTGVARRSRSNDNIWMRHSDLKVVVSGSSYTFIVDRPFGEVYGDLSFVISNINGGLPTPGKVNPARLYPGTEQIDAVEELYPAILIAGKGGYQYDPSGGDTATLMTEVGGGLTMDPYDVNEPGWVRMPAGARIMLQGKVYILDKDYPIKVGTSGTMYCYIRWTVSGVIAVASSVKLETGNHQIMFGIARNGILEALQDYLVLDDHVVSQTREGSAIPVFIDDGGRGVNRFFTRRDF